MYSFTSVYRPSYLSAGSSLAELKKKYGRTAIAAIAAHMAVIVLLLAYPQVVVKQPKDEVVIEVNSAVVVPDGYPDAEPEKPKKTTPPTPPVEVSKDSEIKLDKQPKVKEVPKSKEKTEPIKPAVNEPVKQEPVIEPPIPAPTVSKEEPIKKAEIKDLTPEKKKAAQPDATMDAPKSLPTIVDKKNKEKDAPELAAAKAMSADGSTASPVTQPVSTGAAASAATATAAAATSASMQAHVSNAQATPAPPGVAGGASTDAQYSAKELNNRMPPYPMMARKMRQEGTVVLNAEVLENGSAGEIRIAVTSGSELLDKVALEAVKKWSFHPAKKDGIPYIQRLRIPITFKL